MTNAVKIKEEEIRPEDIFNEFMALSAHDAEHFFDKSKFVEVNCPGCDSGDTQDSFEKHTFTYNNCAQCGSIYVSPRPDLSELIRYYAVSESQSYWCEAILKKTGEKRKESIMLPNITRIEGIIDERNFTPKRVLDIGAANGTFLTEWKKRHPEAQLVGIEPGQDAAAKCRDLGIETYESSVEEEAEKGDAQGDLVTCFEVIEHVQDPDLFAKAIHAVTAPGGYAIMSCLGADGFDIQLLWEKSRSLQPPYHLNFLSHKGMTNLFSTAGFEDVHIFTPGRLDVQIVEKSIERGISPDLSRFEKLLLSRGEETLAAFQKFLAEHALSSHVWIVCKKSEG